MTKPSAADLVETWLDLAVYAPIGLLAKLRDELPSAIASGRQQAENRVQVARFVGQMAVTYGKAEVDRRLQQARSQPPEKAPTPASSLPDAPAQPAVDGTDSRSAVVAAVANVNPPFADYDALPASQIVQRINRLSNEEIAQLVAYEQSNRARRTVLAKAEQVAGRS